MSPFTLTPDQVRKALGASAYPRNYVPAEPETVQARRLGADARMLRDRVRRHEAFIICRYLEGYSPEVIAAMLAAHPETVRLRLRKARLFAAKGRGKPVGLAVPSEVAWFRRGVSRTYSGMIPQTFIY